MSSDNDEKIGPIDPERFHLALGVYQATLATEAPPANAGESHRKRDRKGRLRHASPIGR